MAAENPKQRRIQVWQDTEQLIRSMPVPPIGSVSYDTNKFPVTHNTGHLPCPVYVVSKDCLEVAQALTNRSHTAGHIAILNMANDKTIGGGYRHGAGAQEENLIRRTNLLSSLMQLHDPARTNHYRDLGTPGSGFDGEHHCLYSQGVTVLKGSEASGYQKLQRPFSINVITSAACNLNQDQYSGINFTDQSSTGFQIYYYDMKCRIRQQLRTAVACGQTILVLSAFGCGAFGNDPAIVARLYNEVLQEAEFIGCFQEICFAIIPNPGANAADNFPAFQAQFPAQPPADVMPPAAPGSAHIQGNNAATPAAVQALGTYLQSNGWAVTNGTTSNTFKASKQVGSQTVELDVTPQRIQVKEAVSTKEACKEILIAAINLFGLNNFTVTCTDASEQGLFQTAINELRSDPAHSASYSTLHPTLTVKQPQPAATNNPADIQALQSALSSLGMDPNNPSQTRTRLGGRRP